jgi:hypothetical protein
MADAREQKRSAIDNCNPLQHSGVLQIVLSYVGLGHYFYVALVSKQWRDLYASLQSKQLTVYGNESWHKDIIIICVPEMTLFSRIFASSSRVRLAYENGLACTSGAFMRAAGNHADIATIATAHSLGMPYAAAMMAAAASDGYTAMVQYLHAQQCPWDSNSTYGAARYGHVGTLRWLMNIGCPWSTESMRSAGVMSDSVEMLTYLQQKGFISGVAALTAVLKDAGYHNKLAAAKWLKAQGAQWPTDFRYTRWSDEVLAWARTEGCTTPGPN